MPKHQRQQHHHPGPAGWLARVPRRVASALALFCAVQAAANPASAPGTLGTLFYSAAERDAITQARQGGAPDGTAALSAVSRVVSVSGVVKRGRGKSTAWLNGRAVIEGQSLPPSSHTRISASGVSLDGQRLRVGEVLDLISRERTDIVSPGMLSTRTRP